MLAINRIAIMCSLRKRRVSTAVSFFSTSGTACQLNLFAHSSVSGIGSRGAFFTKEDIGKILDRTPEGVNNDEDRKPPEDWARVSR
jgi:hypothetical protein